MSRSRIKTKIHGITTVKFEKENKQAANRKLRRIVRKKLIQEKLYFQNCVKFLMYGILTKMGKNMIPK